MISRLLFGPRKAHGPRERGSALTAGLAGAGLAVVALLAGAALVAVLGRQTTASYSTARSQTETAISQIEACYATRHDYRQCALPALLSTAGLSVGTGAGQVRASALSVTSYSVMATSSAPGPHGRGHATFTAFRDLAGIVRICNRPGLGGCQAAGTW